MPPPAAADRPAPANTDEWRPTRRGRRAMAVLWPSFLGAAAIEMLVFGLIDPVHVQLPGGNRLELGEMTLYSLAFFAFWGVCAAVAWMTQRLDEPSFEVNSRALD